jgi:nanoRNase/pAp phosphatase (c-di-AMP/oligoRNAs hydrolase)
VGKPAPTRIFYIDKLDHPDTKVIAADYLTRIEGVSRVYASGVFEEKLVVISLNIRSGNLDVLAQEAFGDYGSAGGHKNRARAETRLNDVDPKGAMKPARLFNFVRRRVRDVLAKKAALATEASRKKRSNTAHNRSPPGSS